MTQNGPNSTPSSGPPSDPPSSPPGKQTGYGMLVVGWIAVLGLLTWYFGGRVDEQNHPNRDAGVVDRGDYREIQLEQNRQGHYVLDGTINGADVTFLLDTGATDVVIPDHLAARLRLIREGTARARTANGQIEVFRTTIAALRIGTLELRDIDASLNPHMPGEEVLLGMSAMRDIEMVQRGRQLSIRYR